MCAAVHKENQNYTVW